MSTVDASATYPPSPFLIGMTISSPNAYDEVHTVPADSTRSRWSRQTNRRRSLRISAPGSRCDSHSTWKPLHMPSTGRPRLAPSITRSITGAHDRVHTVQVGVGVPERYRLATGEAHRTRGVAVVERAGERDDADSGGHGTPSGRAGGPIRDYLAGGNGRSGTADGEVLDHGVGQQGLGDRAHRLLGGAVGHLQLEVLALPDAGHPVETQPGQRTQDRLALRVEDLRLEHDVDDDARHVFSLVVRPHPADTLAGRRPAGRAGRPRRAPASVIIAAVLRRGPPEGRDDHGRFGLRLTRLARCGTSGPSPAFSSSSWGSA